MLLSEKPLTTNELKSLDYFLASRPSEKNKLNLTYTHGFLCAILTAPTLTHAACYLLFRDAGNWFIDINDEQNLYFSRFVYQISCDLQQNTFSPLLFENNFIRYEEAPWELIKEWCLGYLRAARLDPLWIKNDEALTLMMPMGILADEFSLIGLTDKQNQLITDNLPYKIFARRHLPISIANLYSYWAEQRTFHENLNSQLH